MDSNVAKSEKDDTLTACLRCSFEVFCANNEDIVRKKYLLKKKQALHVAGDKFMCLYAIKQGALKTYEIDPMGNEIIHGLYLKNELYGYEAIHSGTYIFSVEALSDTEICEISYPAFLALLHEKPNLLSRILYLMSQQLTFGTYLKSITAQQRIAAFLLDLWSRLSVETSTSDFLLPMTYQDIGCYLGLATETVSRILSQFKKNKIIAIDKKMMTMFKPDRLKVIAAGHICART